LQTCASRGKLAPEGEDQIHHNIMIEYDKIIDKMALSLFQQFNGESNGLTIDHFKMVAANGLFEAMEANAASNNNFKNLYLEFKSKYESKDAELKAKKLKLSGCD